MSGTGIGSRPFALGTASGAGFAALSALAFPPVSWWPAALAAPAALVWAAWAAARSATPRAARRTAAGALVGSLPFWAWTHWWVLDVSAAGAPPLMVMLACWSALFVLCAAAVLRRAPGWPAAAVTPALWLGLETLRADVVLGGYPWYAAAHPLIDMPGGATLAWLGGVPAVGVVSLAIAGGLVDACRAGTARRAGLSLGGAAALVVVAAAAWRPGVPGGARAEVREGDTLRVAAVQTNVPQSVRGVWTLEQRYDAMRSLAELTRAAAAAGAELIVWPETMYPGPFGLTPDALEAERRAGLDTVVFAEALLALQAEVGVPMLVGASPLEGLTIEPAADGGLDVRWDDRFNSVHVVADGAVTDRRYDKVSLTPFGERMPVISRWPWLERRLLAIGARGMSFDLSSGAAPTALRVEHAGGALGVGAPICFEATRAGVCRRAVFGPEGRSAGLLVNPTNDGWFGASPVGRRAHLLLARWRSAELATPMLRAANTGVSAAIDRRGRVTALGPTTPSGAGAERSEGVVIADVTLGVGGPTPFARWGHALPWVALAAGAALGAWALVKPMIARRRSGAGAPEEVPR